MKYDTDETKHFTPEELDQIEQLASVYTNPEEMLLLVKYIPTLVSMARQLTPLQENYEIMGRAWDISDGSYDRKLRRGECVCSGYRDIEDRKVPDPACPIHGEVTE